MIDTDKYEGHTEEVWADFLRSPHGNNANRRLLADAQLLLAEVERLREGIDRVAKIMQRFAEIYFTHPTHDELADDVDGFIKDIMELIE